MRKLVLLVTALTLTTLAVPAVAAKRPTPPTVRFTSPFDDRGTVVYGVYQCGLTQTGICDFKFDGVGHFTGPLTTVADYFGYGHGDPAKGQSEGESWDHHVGSLKGCGDGSFVMHQTEIIGDFKTFDPVTQTYAIKLKWEIVRGSGTGAFTDATGRGTAQGRSNLQFANKGTYSGEITCPRGSARMRGT